MIALRLLSALAILTAVAALLAARENHAAAVPMTFVVNYGDDAGHQGDGQCTTNPGGCTLRDAIDAANANPGHDIINFDPAVFPPGGFGTIYPRDLPLPRIDASQGVTIDGTGAGVTISGAQMFSPATVLEFFSGPGQTLHDVVLREITIVQALELAVRICGGLNVNNDTCAYDVSTVTIEHVSATGDVQFDSVLVQGANIDGVLVDDLVPYSRASGLHFLAGNDLSDIEVRGSSFLGGGGSSMANGVRFDGPHDTRDITVTDNQFENLGVYAMVFEGGTARDIQVTQNMDGYAFAGHVSFAYGSLVNATVAGNQFGSGGYLGAVLVQIPGPVNGLVIEDNIIQDALWGIIYRTYGGEGSFIRGNTLHDVTYTAVNIDQYFGQPPTRVTISRNSIYDISGQGIVLNGSGNANVNDPGDTDTGANDQLNFPVITGDNGQSVTGTACANCLVELFVADAAANVAGDGKVFVADATADGTGDFTLPICDEALTPGTVLTSTATDASGNTSQFSNNYALSQGSGQCPTPTPSPTPSPTPTASPSPSPTPISTGTPLEETIAGDLDCDGDVTPLDSLVLLLFLGELPFDQEPPCPGLDDLAGDFQFADVNCDGVINAADAVAILAFAGETGEAEDGCPPIGEPL